MEKMLLVLKHEFRIVVLRKSFFITLLLVPIIATIVFAIFGSLGGIEPTSAIGRIISSPEEVKPEGVIDQSGLIKSMMAGIEEDLILFPDEAAANQALQAGQIGSFLLHYST